MAVVALDREAARAAIRALLRETDDIERPTAGTNWTVAETAAHASCVCTGFSAAIAGEPQTLIPEQYLQADFPTRLAATNAATIATVDHTDEGRLAELITAGAQRFQELLAPADPEMECETPWYGPGRTRTRECLTALALSELTVYLLPSTGGCRSAGQCCAAGFSRRARPWLGVRFRNFVLQSVTPFRPEETTHQPECLAGISACLMIASKWRSHFGGLAATIDGDDGHLVRPRGFADRGHAKAGKFSGSLLVRTRS